MTEFDDLFSVPTQPSPLPLSSPRNNQFRLSCLNARLAKSIVQTTLETFGYLVSPYGYEIYQSLIHSHTNTADMTKHIRNAPDFIVRVPRQEKSLLLKVHSTTDQRESSHRPAYNDQLAYYRSQWPNMAIVVCCVRTANLYCSSLSQIKGTKYINLTQDWKTFPQYFKQINPKAYTVFHQQLTQTVTLFAENAVGCSPRQATHSQQQSCKVPSKHKGFATRQGVNITIVGLQQHLWKDTVWENDTIPINIRPPKVPAQDNRYIIEVYGKALGALASEETSPALLGQHLAILTTDRKHIDAQLIGDPTAWKNPYMGDTADQFSKYIQEEYTYNFELMNEELKGTTPDRMYEWDIRLSAWSAEEQKIQAKVSNEDSEKLFHLHFVKWLQDTAVASMDTYGDAEMEQYKKHVIEQNIKNQDIIEGMHEMMADDGIQTKWGAGATQDEYGVVISSDGEVLWMD